VHSTSHANKAGSVNHFMPSTETKQRNLLALVRNIHGIHNAHNRGFGWRFGGENGAGFLAAAPIDRLACAGAGADGIESDDGAARVAALAVKR